MPLINGQKMACEPCIRGHRSTKCTHANERLMVPVRKPGRPLSTCPHPASRPCSCGQVTAAIPKKQKCGCGTSNGESLRAKSEDEPSKETTPQSPTKAVNTGFRIQKAAGKSVPSSRKQSVDTTGLERLERMDPSQLNIISNFNGITPTHTPPSIPDMSTYGPIGMTSPGTPFMPIMFPMFQPQMPPPMMSPDGISAVTNGHLIPTPHGSSNNLNGKPVAKMGSCCGGGENTEAVSPPKQPSTAASSPGPANEGIIKSCCSSKRDSPKTEPVSDSLPPSDLPTPNSIMMSPFQTPMMMMPNGMYGFYPQQNVFTYPPNYGSFMQPLQPEQWRQVMASMNFGQGAVPPFYNMPGAIPFNAPNTPQPSTGTSHQCSCGDTCQCVGCAAHPYNDATKSYVRSAWESMHNDSQNGIHTNGAHTPTTNGLSNGNTAAVSYPPENQASPNPPHTPSEAASGMSEEQTLSANDFFFVSYPFDDACEGEMANCPCGDDCQCLGCVIHNNPGPDEEVEQQVPQAAIGPE